MSFISISSHVGSVWLPWVLSWTTYVTSWFGQETLDTPSCTSECKKGFSEIAVFFILLWVANFALSKIYIPSFAKKAFDLIILLVLFECTGITSFEECATLIIFQGILSLVLYVACTVFSKKGLSNMKKDGTPSSEKVNHEIAELHEMAIVVTWTPALILFVAFLNALG